MTRGTPVVTPPAAGPPRARDPLVRADSRPHAPVTPIWISRRTRTVLLLVATGVLLLLLYRAPSLIAITLGGVALALVLSFPVQLLERVMPRSLAITLALLLLLAAVVLVVVGLVPILIEQLGALVDAVPGIAARVSEQVPSILDWFAARGLLPSTPEQFLDEIQGRMLGAVQGFAGRILGGLGGIVTRVVDVVITLFGVVFIAVYLLADARRIKAAALRATPHRYRRDALALSDAFGLTLSRYLGGLLLSLGIQGFLSAVALYFLGVPYAIVLGAWVSVTALIPYLGAWLGGIPAVLLALSVSPTRALLTVGLFFLIQQLEGNVLTPRIQSQAVRVHPILVFLAVIAGGEIAGIPGIIFAVPTLAVLRVLFDFFRARLRTLPASRADVGAPG